MREEKNKAESIPARSEARRPRRSRSREAFKQRQKELAESRAQERRVQENKLQENKIQETGGRAKTELVADCREMTVRELWMHREKVIES